MVTERAQVSIKGSDPFNWVSGALLCKEFQCPGIALTVKKPIQDI